MGSRRVDFYRQSKELAEGKWKEDAVDKRIQGGLETANYQRLRHTFTFFESEEHRTHRL